MCQREMCIRDRNGIVAEDNMRVAVVDLVEVGDGFKIAVQLPGVFKAGVVVAPDQVLMLSLIHI